MTQKLKNEKTRKIRINAENTLFSADSEKKNVIFNEKKKRLKNRA